MSKMPYFKDKEYWALILGGSSGLGLATAKKLAEEGMHLFIVHRDRKQGLKALAPHLEEIQSNGVTCITFNMDATRTESQESILKKIKETLPAGHQLKVLLHSISRGNLKPLNTDNSISSNFLEATLDHEKQALYSKLESDIQDNQQFGSNALNQQDLNLTLDAMALSLYHWLKAIVKESIQASDFRVLGLTSEGSSKAWKGYAGVSIAKASLEALCRSIALEFAPMGIRCNLVQAGVTDTPSLRMIPGSEHIKLNAILKNPFHRLTRPEDVANAIYLLCREESQWINGAIIPVDGGESIT